MQARGAEPDEATEDLLGDATAFVGVGRYPARIKCALLGWMALKDALIQANVTPEGELMTDSTPPANAEAGTDGTPRTSRRRCAT